MATAPEQQATQRGLRRKSRPVADSGWIWALPRQPKRPTLTPCPG